MPQARRRPRGMRMADDVHRALRIRAAEAGKTMEDILDEILRRELGLMEWQTEQVECKICGFGGAPSPATKRVLGRDACDQCAAELEAALQIGPAIWLVEVSDGEELEAALRTRPAIWMVEGSEADFGTVDYGPHSFGWRDPDAAEEYAQRVGAEVREAFLVEVIGADEGDVLAAAGLTDWARFDGPVAVVWPHYDEEGLRRRLLYGADA